MEKEEYSSKELNHLGVVAGLCDELGITEIVNEAIGINSQEIFNVGEVVKLMVINGLGFVSKPLYLYSKFFSTKPLEILLNREVREEEEVSDDKLGRVLDKIYKYGSEKLFTTISSIAYSKYGVGNKFFHLDSTTMSVHGEYEESEKTGEPVLIKYGYSKDNRPDLKQFMVSLMCSGDGGVPLLSKTVAGNTNDQTHFREILKSLKTEFKSAESPKIYVADAAMYSKETISELGDSVLWLSRVPRSLKECKELYYEQEEMEIIDENYSVKEIEKEYGGVKQRWFVIFSKESHQSNIKKFDKSVEKIESEINARIRELKKEVFSCDKDLESVIEKFKSSLIWHECVSVETEKKEKFCSVGKPKKDEKPEIVWGIKDIQIKKDKSKIEIEKRKRGFFVLATNVLDKSKIDGKSALENYKNQQKVERGFRFLKSQEFLVSAVFLKKQSRIEALSMIMCLCLLVYSLAERLLRKNLEQLNKKYPNQVKKMVANPTMRWVFDVFDGIHVLYQGDKQINDSLVLNIKNVHRYTLSIMGEFYLKYYKIKKPLYDLSL